MCPRQLLFHSIYIGSNGPFPGKSTKATMEDIKSEYETLAKAIEKSDEIVIIGGGPVGVEMAGEIVDRYKDKKIHLIHSGNHLVTKEFGDTFQTNMRWCLDNANVEVILSKNYFLQICYQIFREIN